MRLILLLLAIIVFNYTTYTDGFQVEDEHRERELMAAGTTTVVWEQWETEGPKPLPRKNMAYGLLGDKFVIYGGEAIGENDEPYILGDMWQISVSQPSPRSWEPIPRTQAFTPGNRTYSAFATLDGSLYLFGGLSQEVTPNGNVVTKMKRDLWRYDIETNQWTELQISGDLPDTSWGASAAFLNSTYFVLNGGYTYSGRIEVLSEYTYYIDVTKSEPSWKVVPKVSETDHPQGAIGVALFTSRSDLSVIRYGGSLNRQSGLEMKHYYLGFQRGLLNNYPTWKKLDNVGSSGPSLYFHTALENDCGLMVLFGGSQNKTHQYSNDIYMSPLFSDQSFLRMTPAEGTAIPPPRHSHGAVMFNSNYMLVFGGEGPSSNGKPVYLNDLWSVSTFTPIDPAHTTISKCPEYITAGTSDQCFIQAKDQSGFPTGAEEFVDYFRVQLRIKTHDQQIIDLPAPELTYAGRGLYIIKLKPKISGELRLTAFYNETKLAGTNPLSIIVIPSEIDPVASSLECPENAVVGISFLCHVHARDEFNNPSGNANDVIAFTVSVYHSQECEPISLRLSWMGTVGEFAFNATPPAENQLMIKVTYTTSTISGSGVVIRVYPNNCFGDVNSKPVPDDPGNCMCISGYHRAQSRCIPCMSAQRKEYDGDCCCTCDTGFYNATEWGGENGTLVQCIDLIGRTFYDIPERTFKSDPSNPCVMCPPCLQCDEEVIVNGGAIIAPHPAPGYWSGRRRNQIYACYNEDACTGNETICAEGYHGPLCSLCKDGYSSFDYTCTKCGSRATTFALLVIELIGVLIVVIFLVITANRPKSRLSILPKILVNYIHTIALLGAFRLHLPAIAAEISNALSSVTFGPKTAHFYDCLFRLDHYQKLALNLLLLGVVVGPGIIVFGIRYGSRLLVSCFKKMLGTNDRQQWAYASLRYKNLNEGSFSDDSEATVVSSNLESDASKYDTSDDDLVVADEHEEGEYAPPQDNPKSKQNDMINDDSNVDNEAEQKITFSTTWWHFYSSVCLVFLFLSYPLLSTLIMQSLIPCIEIDGERYLPVDLSIKCDNERYRTWTSVSWLLLIVFSGGLVVFTFVLLYKNRNNLDTLRTRSRYMFLYDGYRRTRWYWELVISARKICVIVLAAFLSSRPLTQAFLGITLLNFALWAQLTAQPYKEKRLNNLEVTALMMSIGTLIASLFYETDTDTIMEKVLTYIILGANGLFVVVMVVLIVIEVVLYVRQKAGKVIRFVKRRLKKEPKELQYVAEDKE